MSKKNITITVLTDLYYARFIASWRPEEEDDYIPPEDDKRTSQEKNIPNFLVLTSMYKGRIEVSGVRPVITSQHPMPEDFLKKNIRHICYMFANDYGVFKPASNAHAATFLSKMKLGFQIVKELKVSVSSYQDTMTLKDFKEELKKYTDEELSKIQVPINGENDFDVFNRISNKALFNAKEFDDDNNIITSPYKQFFSLTRLANVYNVSDPYINNSILPESGSEDLLNSYEPNTENDPLVQEQINLTEDAIANNEADLEVLKTYDEMTKAFSQLESDTVVSDTIPQFTAEEVQHQTIKKLQAKIKSLESKK